MLQSLSGIFVFVLALTIIGCDKPAEPAAEVVKATSLGITADCVICVDHPLEVTDRTAHADYQGKTYYFCSNGCKEDFEKDPVKAIAKYEKEKAPASQPSTAPSH